MKRKRLEEDEEDEEYEEDEDDEEYEEKNQRVTNAIKQAQVHKWNHEKLQILTSEIYLVLNFWKIVSYYADKEVTNWANNNESKIFLHNIRLQKI